MSQFKKHLLNSAWNFEKELSKQKWDELVKIVKASDLEIKENITKEGIGEKGIIIGIYGIDDMYIKISHLSQDGMGAFANIQIYNHSNYEGERRIQQPKSVSNALEYIDEFIQAIKTEKK